MPNLVQPASVFFVQHANGWQQSKLQAGTLSQVDVYYYAHWLIVASSQLLVTLFTATCIQQHVQSADGMVMN